MKSSGWAKKGDLVSNHPSIWKPDFLLNKKMTAETAEKEEEGRRRSSVGAFVAGGSTVPKEKERVINVGPSDFKRKREEGKCIYSILYILANGAVFLNSLEMEKYPPPPLLF